MENETDRFQDIELETKCSYCHSRGYERDCDHCPKRPCGVCNGSGNETTPFGEKVLDLMRHNFRPMLRDATAD